MTTSITRVIWCALIGLLFAPVTARAQDVVVYYHTDAIGSIRAMTDETGAVIHRYDFLPFGEAWLPPANADTRQFAGKERDRETGLDLDYFGARYHLPVIGRFTTVDPVMNIEAAMADPQRWNRYAYALSNPFKFTDSDGRDPRVVGGAIGTVVFAGWNAYLNVQSGRPWYENIGVEAGKGFIVGFTLGLAAPAVTAVDLGVTTTAARTSVITATGIDAAVRSGAESRGQQGTVALRHLASHVDRGDPSFKGVTKTAETALGLIRSILTDPSRLLTSASGRTADVYNAVGQGVRIDLQTGKFIGFLDATKELR